MTVVRYVGHTGTEFILDGAPGIGMSRGEVLDWQYSVQQLGGKVDCLYRDSVKFDGVFLGGRVGCLTASAVLDPHINLLARAGAALPPGRLYVGDLFIPVIQIGMEKRYSEQDEVFKCVGRFSSDSPQWSRDREFQFRPREDAHGLDFPHDHPHDYSPSWFSGAVLNASPLPCPVRIRVEGPAKDWHVRIAGNVYSCDKELRAGELLLIDGVEEKIWHTDDLGNVSSAFDTWAGTFEEGSGSFVFEWAPSGELPISWDGCDALSITLREMYDEWPWGSIL